MADALIKNRTVLKSKLTRFQTFISNINITDSDSVSEEQILDIQNRLDANISLLSEFDQIQSEIIQSVDDVEKQNEQHIQFEDTYFRTIAKAQSLLNKLNANSKNNSRSKSPTHSLSTGHSSMSHNKAPLFNLPKISIPKFSGALENWLEFREIFNSLIHSNDDLSDIQRLHYLKSSLVGDAAQVVKSLQFSASNYKIAWNSICARYDQPRMLIRNHLKSILDLDSCTKESATKLRNFSDALFKHITALKSLAKEEQLFEIIIIHIMSNKLDAITSREWESLRNNSGSDLPTLDEFKKFLTNTANLLDSLPSKPHVKVTQEKTKINYSKSFATNTISCMLCKGSHILSCCDQFLELTPQQRLSKAKELKICINCLYKGHLLPQCTSKYTCRTCRSKHHSLLHAFPSKPNSSEQPESSVSADTPVAPSLNISAFCKNSAEVLLPTASAKIFDSQGRPHSIRILLDSGSQSNFIRHDLCQKLMINVDDANVLINGISKSSSHIRSRCDVVVHAHDSNFKVSLSCLVLDEITGIMPSFHLDRNSFKIPSNVRLSDSTFAVPGKIDMLIGSQEFFNLLCVGQIRLGPNLPILQKTRFGWVVSGPSSPLMPVQASCHLSVVDDISDCLSKFWELDSYPTEKVLSPEENACEDHFVKTSSRDSTGRFIVSLPFKKPVELLGNSYEVAQKRFLALERRLQSNLDLYNRYSLFMQEYQDLGHMTLSNPDTNTTSYYLPHHGVLKEDSLTTKLRVVFNGSSPTTSGHSLNDLQMIGPTIQQDLFSILIRFRKHTYAVSADIEKMYRQVLIKPSERSLQRVLWRSSPTHPLQSFDLNTVTYGTASASFLAIRCLHQLAIECEDSKPHIANIIKSDFYVDDLLTGADNIDEARAMCTDLTTVLRTGCFTLRKWISNDPNILSDFPDSEVHPGIIEINSHDRTTTLGLTWSFKADTFTFVTFKSSVKKVTKRVILSEISQIFDPLGILAPCIVSAKILLQQLWLEKLSWDDSVPHNILTKWLLYREELSCLSDINIPRHVICRNASNVQIHGFCDASTYAYGACIYVRSVDPHNRIHSFLLCSKTKVAPLKPVTIPRLELCGAVLLSKLSEQVLKALDMPVSEIYLWSDSTIVLGWLKTSPNLLKTFVCNRVADIQERTSRATWKHVPTKDNPADLLSRGVTPPTLASSSLWWHGPSWLIDHESSWPESISSKCTLPDMKKEVQSFVTVCNAPIAINNFSDMNRLQRVVAFCLRFRNNCSKTGRKSTGPLTTAEMRSALLCLIKISQRESFSEELRQLESNQPLKRSSSLLNLNPFLDNNGIIRVGGRLQNGPFNLDKKHPFLIPGRHHLAKLIVTREHLRMLHAGPQLLLSSLRERFWITSGRCLIKQVVHQCLRCCRFSPKLSEPIMGNLPQSRVQPSPPFYTTGVDYGGPFLVKDRNGRGSKLYKSYLCLFVCFVTKAVHLELVTSLSTEAFIMTFRRFVARRGKPLHMYSDNGTNFTGARSELKELSSFFIKENLVITEAINNEGTEWHFTPAHSPHFGGLWEAGIKSAKHHLKRVLGNSVLTYEELSTLLTQVEATLNSRPLSPLSSDPNDLHPLTPAHFLIGRSLMALPDPDVSDIKQSRLNRYQLIQQLHQRIWKRWSKEYISTLQQRLKWKSNTSNLQIGMLVFIKEDHLPPLRWKLGRVVQLHPGHDGVNRVVSIKTASGVVRRSFSKVCPLPIETVNTE